MKAFTFSLLISLLFIALCSCSDDNDSRQIEFWTDKDLSSTTFDRLLINDFMVGTFVRSTDMAMCGNAANIVYNMPTNTMVDISVANDAGETSFIGSISLDDFTSGISVTGNGMTDETAISVAGTSDDECTTIFLMW